MKIKSIKYPEGRLAGWNKMVFERRMRRILGSFFSVCDLDLCRATILGQEPDRERRDELSLFHCESFKGMTLAEVQALADKAAQYVGVEITLKRASRIPGVVLAAVAGIAIGAAGAWLIPALNDVKSVTRAHPVGSLASEVSLPILPFSSNAEVPPEPVFSTTVRTKHPAATARKLANAVQSMTGEYDVSLAVTPVNEDVVSIPSPSQLRPQSTHPGR